MRERSRIRTIVEVVALLFAGLLLSSLTTAQAGKNANGALIVHTNDAVSYTATGNYCGVSFDHPGTCEQAGTRTDKAEDEPAVIWFLAAFPDTSSPAVTVVYFGIDHNLPSEEGYFHAWGLCAPSNSLEVPDPGWPEHPEAAGNSVASPTVWPMQAGNLFPFYWFAAYGFEGAYLGTRINPTGGYAGFVDDSNPGVMDEVTRFGTVRWYAAGSNACPSGGEDGGEGGEEGDQGPGGEGESSWLDGDGESMWVRDCILARLRDDLPMPPREPTEELGIPAFDALGAELGLISVQRVLRLSDQDCSRYPVGSRLVSIRFGPDTDELAAAQQFQVLSEIVWAEPSYVQAVELFQSDPGFRMQWYLVGDENATSCLEDPEPECCDECDIGIEDAWALSRGDPNVIVAFIDTGADMQHPDLFDIYARNPDPREDDGDGVVELCPVAEGGDIGDVDGDGYPDDDGNGFADDVILGWRYVFDPQQPDYWRASWEHAPTSAGGHGTKVAGLLGAITNNGHGVASVAGGDETASCVGVGLIQFSFEVDGLFPPVPAAVINSFYYARRYGAQVYSSSARLPDRGGVPDAVSELSDEMLFVAAAGNRAQDSFTNEFARLPGVMAVGGYTCEVGGRWIVPPGHGAGMRGSDYGPELSIMGPTDDYMVDPQGGYPRMVMASTSPATTSLPYVCDPDSLEDTIGCFGGTSAAAPIVASVAALIFSYAYEHELTLTAGQVRKIIERTAEDIRCDLAESGCDCSNPDPNCSVRLLGWDRYTGYGRVDAGRALTLPVAVLEPLSLPHETYVIHGETIHLSWEAFDVNDENGDLGPGARFELHYLIPEDGLENGWCVIADSLPPYVREFDWIVPDTVRVGENRRIRLTVVDSGGHANQDYTRRFWVQGTTSVNNARGVPVLAVHAIVPNPSSKGAKIHYTLSRATDVRVRVLDVAGRHVGTLAQGGHAAGSWTLDWDGRDDSGQEVASGIYFIRLDTGSHAKTVRLVRIQ